MAVQGVQVTVGNTPTVLSGVEGDTGSGYSVLVSLPAGAQTVFLGGAAVAASGGNRGFPLAAEQSITIDLDSGEQLYGIVASGTQLADVLRTGV